MFKRLKLMLIVIVLGSMLLQSGYAQDTSTYDINANIGRVSYLSIDDAINRTGLRAWVNAGYTGDGQNIGVLHPSFNGFDSLNTSASIFTNFSATRDDSNETSILDGTDFLEIIVQIASDANYYLCDYTTLSDFSRCVAWFISQNVQIVHHGTGIYTASNVLEEFLPEVERAVGSDIVWVNAAGNVASGTIRGFITLNDDAFHEFRTTNSTQLDIEPISEITRRITLVWQGDTTLSANEIDLDLEVLDTDGNILTTSNRIQAGNSQHFPIESVVVPPDIPFTLRIRNVDGQGDNIPFVLGVEFGTIIGKAATQSIVLPATSADVMSVGALQGTILAPYSSQGPTETGAIKPDLTTFGEIQLEERKLYGTGVSSAIIAAATVLIREANPNWVEQQVRDFLVASTQDDRQIQGLDTLYGNGRLFLIPPTIPNDPTPLATTEQQSVTLVTTNSTVNFPDDKSIVFIRNQTLWQLDSNRIPRSIDIPGSNYDPNIVDSIVVYASARDGQRLDIYRYDLVNEMEQRLTNHERQDRHPALSPDGSQIAFSSDRDGNWEIYIMAIDGSNLRRLTNSPFTEYAPSWSLDGQSIIFQTEQVDLAPIAHLDLNNGAFTRLANTQLVLVGATLSPDGRSIAMYTLTDNPSAVIIDLASGTVRDVGDGIPGSWFDNNHILVHRREDNDTVNTFIVNIIDGSSSIVIENATWATASQ